MVVRIAKPGEFTEIMSILEGALLDVRSDEVRSAIDSELVHVYVDHNQLIGVIVTNCANKCPRAVDDQFDAGIHIEAVAVRPNRRNQGIGRALIMTILACYDSATVTFEEHAKSFYDALNVCILTRQNNTYVGVLKSGCC